MTPSNTEDSCHSVKRGSHVCVYVHILGGEDVELGGKGVERKLEKGATRGLLSRVQRKRQLRELVQTRCCKLWLDKKLS